LILRLKGENRTTMNLDPIRNRLRAEFKPFTALFNRRTQIPVPHPDFIAVGRGIVVVVNEHDVDQVIDGLRIVSIEDQLPSKA